MRTETPKTIYLKDYKPYPYLVRHIDLNFDIHEGYTLVSAKMDFSCAPHTRDDIFLNGEDLELLEIKLDGAPIEKVQTVEGGIIIPCPHKPQFALEIKTRIQPEKNTRLEGLYKSDDTYCTQCEAEGFRRITYYPDRPDVMATFTMRIEADKGACPVLLGNGNRIDHGEAGHGRHFAVWHDPFPKPCYLFALVAGNLNHVQDSFITKSGRKVELYIYVRPGDESQCDHAMESLKKSMKWDEDVYGLEYDLDIFNIVAVSDFNMGAMENKSLNIFNTALVLAQHETATDSDFMRVESVIAHEYFHNWSGNRVTCRDWFQLSLKEGLTVFRDQEFSSDLHSRAVQRIDDVAHLRRFQFPEDSGPLAHPIRPDNYIEINNFYTMTVYEKGAEVIRMIRTIIGPENYRKGTDLYFSRHDGQAATCDDFVKCMEDASGVDLSHFKLWYEQAGTPEVTFKGKYNPEAKTYTVELSQDSPDTPGQKNKKPMHIPVAVGLLNDNGDDVIETRLLNLKNQSQSFVFKDVASKPVPSVLRNFSAPVRLKTDHSECDLAFLMVHDSDGFNRWEAGQKYFLRTLGRMISERCSAPPEFFETYGDLLDRALAPDADKALMARAISLPEISSLAQEQNVVDPYLIYEARENLLNAIVDQFPDKLEKIYHDNRTGSQFSIDANAMGRRVLQNTAILIFSNRRKTEDMKRAADHYHAANNMTDRMAALFFACAYEGPDGKDLLSAFYERFKSYPLVIDKWFAAQAGVVRADIIGIVRGLRAHPDFNIRNPNRVRSLYSSFAMSNPVSFHAADGSGYKFLTEAVLELNSINPQIAARLLTPMREWRRYTPDRQKLMQECLEEILAYPKLSPDVYEIAQKTIKA